MIKIYRVKASAIIVAVAVLVLAGCGGDDGAGDETEGIAVSTGSLAKAQFLKQANAICQAGTEEVQAGFIAGLRRGQGQTSQDEQAKEIVDEVLVPAYEKQIDEIAALGAPQGDEEEITLILNEIDRALREAESQPLDAIRGANPFASAAKEASAYGLSACGQA